MTAYFLLKSLIAYLQDVIDEYAAAQADGGNYQVPKVFDWYLPFKNPRASEKIDFPYVTAKLVEGTDPVDDGHSPTLSTVRIDISFGVFAEAKDENGFHHPDGAYDLINLMEFVRIRLLRHGVIDNQYRIERPYKWHFPDEQPYPLWVGQAQTIWTVQSVPQQTIEGVDLHANSWEK